MGRNVLEVLFLTGAGRAPQAPRSPRPADRPCDNDLLDLKVRCLFFPDGRRSPLSGQGLELGTGPKGTLTAERSSSGESRPTPPFMPPLARLGWAGLGGGAGRGAAQSAGRQQVAALRTELRAPHRLAPPPRRGPRRSQDAAGRAPSEEWGGQAGQTAGGGGGRSPRRCPRLRALHGAVAEPPQPLRLLRGLGHLLPLHEQLRRGGRGYGGAAGRGETGVGRRGRGQRPAGGLCGAGAARVPRGREGHGVWGSRHGGRGGLWGANRALLAPAPRSSAHRVRWAACCKCACARIKDFFTRSLF